MQLRCLQENLARGLAVVGRAVATRTTLPITQSVLLATDEHRLKLSATNLEIAITTWVGGDISEEGGVAIPARLLTDLINSRPAGTLDVKTLAQGTGIELKGDNFQASLNGEDAKEFPPLPSLGEGVTTSINGDALAAAIRQVALAAAADDTRPVLAGVNVEIEGTQMTLAAADGYRLAVRTLDVLEPVEEKVSVIIPARTMNEVERLVDGSEPVVFLINAQRSQALFKMRDIEVVSQLIAGTFPNYQQLIPAEHTTRTVVDIETLQRAARSASLFARDSSGIIRLEMGPGDGSDSGKLTVASRADEVGDVTTDIAADFEGSEQARIAFNSRFLNDVLGVIGKDRVVIEMTTSSSPGVIRGLDDPNYVHVVMPMFVQW